VIASFRGKAVIVTGGTAGIGLATALAFARHGASCVLTYRFGTADEDAVRARFR
jgi:NAD(P)-dependent dehydrogenase (short-subunit alcohol dehydrogenase family)